MIPSQVTAATRRRPAPPPAESGYSYVKFGAAVGLRTTRTSARTGASRTIPTSGKPRQCYRAIDRGGGRIWRPSHSKCGRNRGGSESGGPPFIFLLVSR